MQRGHSKRQKRHVKGIQFAPSSELIKQLHKTKMASDLRLGSVPLVKNTETEHILITGTTGSGKTNCFHELMPQIRRRGERAVIVDTTGDFVERYYRKGQDKILNPLDQRGEPWHVWAECAKPYHYDDLAEAMIPQLDHDSFWTNAARTVVMFSMPDRHVAERMATALGQQEISETMEGVSFGSHQVRDGVSLSEQRKIQPTIMPEDLMKLKLPGDLLVLTMRNSGLLNLGIIQSTVIKCQVIILKRAFNRAFKDTLKCIL